MKEATYVAISTQKGGAGKTTLTVLVASYLHYVKGYNVAVVDCDFPQYSIHDMRKRDMKAVMEDGHYKVLAAQTAEEEPVHHQMQPCGRCGKDRRKSGGSAARS